MQEGLPYGAEIKRRCLLFLDGGLKELYDTVLVRRTARQPQTYSAVDCEQLLRDEVTKRRKGGDVRGMVDVLERSLFFWKSRVIFPTKECFSNRQPCT